MSFWDDPFGNIGRAITGFFGGDKSASSAPSQQTQNTGSSQGGASGSWDSPQQDNSAAQAAAEEERRRREEEERKRKEAEAQQREAEQKAREAQFNQRLTLADPTKPGLLQKPVVPQQPVIKDTRSETQKQLDEIYNQEVEKAKEEESKKLGWFDKTFTDRDWEKRAENTARNRAATIYQDRNGWNADPEVLKYSGQTLEKANQLSKDAQAAVKSGEDFQKGMVKTAQIGQYVPVFGTVVNWGLAGNEALQKAAGNEADAKAMEDIRNKVDFDMSSEEFQKLDKATQDKLHTLQNVGLGAGVLDFTGAGGLAKSSLVSAGKKAAVETATQGAVKAATKQAVKEAALAEGKNIAKNAAVGTGVSLAGQAYLTDGKHVDPLQAAKDGTMLGFTSALFSPAQLKKGAAKNSVDEAVDAATHSSTLKNAAENADTAAQELIPGVKTKNVSADAPRPEVSVGMIDKLPEPNLAVPRETPVMKPEAPLITPQPATQTIPDPANPIALQKNPQLEEVPIANFNNAIKAAPIDAPVMPEKAPAVPSVEQPAQAVDVNGNTALVSDAQRARDLAQEGIVPEQTDSVAGAQQADAQMAAEQRLQQQVQRSERPDVSGAKAPDTAEQMISSIPDDEAASAVAANLDPKQNVAMQDIQIKANQIVRETPVEDLITRYSRDFSIGSNQHDAYFESVAAFNRLKNEGAGTTPEGIRAMSNISNALLDRISESGRGLNMAKALWNTMPTEFKADSWVKKLGQAGVDQPDQYREGLYNRLKIADDYNAGVTKAKEELQTLRDGLESGSIDGTNPAVIDTARALNDDVQKLTRQAELAAGDAIDMYKTILPPTSFGDRAATFARTSMLSAPTGRVYDLFSTGTVSGIDNANAAASALTGKLINAMKGAGTVTDTMPSLRRQASGVSEGLSDSLLQMFTGRSRVQNANDAIARMPSRSEITTNSQVGWGQPLKKLDTMARNFVSGMVETPTNLSKGIEKDILYRKAVQEGEKLGFKGKELDTYAEVTKNIQSSAVQAAANDSYLRVNNLHRNAIGDILNAASQTAKAKTKDIPVMRSVAPILENMIMPFKSWVSGNITRTLVDANIPVQAGKLAVALKRGDMQGVADSVGKLAVNSGIYGLGFLMAQNGMITDTDGNGDGWAGRYFKIGDTYIPVGILGPYAAPIIFGAATNDAANSEGGLGPNLADATWKAATDTVASMGVSSTFGGTNTLMTAISSMSQPGTEAGDVLPNLVGNTVGQYIPALGQDINAVLNQDDALNPTHEAADTKAKKINPDTGREVTDDTQTAINKLLNKVPGLSQQLPRKEDVAAQTLGERTLKANHATEGMKATQAEKQAEVKSEKDRKERGVPETSDGIEAKLENGEFDLAIEGYKYQMAQKEKKGELSKSRRQEFETQVKRAEVTRDKNYDPSVIKLYEKTSLTEWRNMGNPNHEDYNPEMYVLLGGYDQDLTDAGVSRSSKDGSKNKYYASKTSGGGSRRSGGSGGKSSSAPKLDFNIATQTFTSSPEKMKMVAVNTGEKGSAIPQVARVQDYDTSKLRKVKLTKGLKV